LRRAEDLNVQVHLDEEMTRIPAPAADTAVEMGRLDNVRGEDGMDKDLEDQVASQA